MAKHDAGTPSNDESADEVADQFSSAKPRSKNKADDARVRTPSKTNSSRKSQKADEIEVTSDDEEPSKGKADDDDDEEDEAGEDEYEIERIVDVEVGAIDEGPDEICYFVHWKGYSDEEDSWTTEANASGAQELIKNFWKAQKRAGKPSRQELLDAHEAKKARKNKKRKSLNTPVAKKPRASDAVDASSEDLGDIATKKSATKRRRKSNAMDVDEETTGDGNVPLSKKRKSGASTDHTNGRTASKKSPIKDVALEYSTLQNDLIKDTMARYGRNKSWEEIVKTITTVEKREEDSVLQIFWTSIDGYDCLTPSTSFSKRCPQKLIQFYESNLKWRPHDGPEGTNAAGGGDAMQE